MFPFIKKLRDECTFTKRPLIFFDDDPDGLVSYLLLDKIIGEGYFVCVRSSPTLGVMFMPKIADYDPDKVFILDKPGVDEALFNMNKHFVWIDHHDIQEVNRSNVTYFNSKVIEGYYPTSEIIYRVFEEELSKWKWLAVLGIIADYAMPNFVDDVRQEFSGLIDKEDINEIIMNTKLGVLINVFSFAMKGSTQKIKQNISALRKVKNPFEILNQTSPPGKFIWKHYEDIEKKYQNLKETMDAVEDNKTIICKYPSTNISFSRDLASELSKKNPTKVIIIAREKDGTYRGSIRSMNFPVYNKVMEAMKGIGGYSGGHDHALGFNIPIEDFDQFIQQLKEQL